MIKMKSLDKFQNQEYNTLFGDYIATTEENLSEIRKEAMSVLAESIIIGMDISGYKQAGWKYIEKLSGPFGTANPLDGRTTMGAKIKAKLTATNDQYNHHLAHFALAAVKDHKKEFLLRKEMETWKGFLKFQFNKIKKKFQRKINV